MSSTASRRLYPRQLRRLQVRFWRAGEERPRQGFTKNVSLTGAFVATPDPAGRGDRLRLELSDGARTALLYAVVVHAHRVPPELRRFADSAMGLRFLGLDEVVGPFLGEEALRPRLEGDAGGGRVVGGAHRVGGVAEGGALPGGAAGEPSGSARPGAGTRAFERTTAGAPPPRPYVPHPGERPGTGAVRSAAEPEGAAAGRRAPSPDAPATGSPAVAYALSFASADDFLAVYRRDVANGGLFVTAERPARLDERVAVDLRLPGDGAPTVRIEGRVVQVVEPRPLASGRVAGGMGLELTDPDGAVRLLAPHVAAFERSAR